MALSFPSDPNYDTCVGGNSCCTGVYRCALGEGDCDPAREDSYYGRPGRMRTVVRGPRKQCMSGLVCSTNDCQTYDYLLRLEKRILIELCLVIITPCILPVEAFQLRLRGIIWRVL